MDSLRGRKIVLILAAILAVILVGVMIRNWKCYNIYVLIISGYLYFAIFIFILIDAYYWIKNKKDLYYAYSLLKDLLMLMIIIFFSYGILNILTEKGIICIINAILLIFPTYSMLKTLDKHYMND